MAKAQVHVALLFFPLLFCLAPAQWHQLGANPSRMSYINESIGPLDTIELRWSSAKSIYANPYYSFPLIYNSKLFVIEGSTDVTPPGPVKPSILTLYRLETGAQLISTNHPMTLTKTPIYDPLRNRIYATAKANDNANYLCAFDGDSLKQIWCQKEQAKRQQMRSNSLGDFFGIAISQQLKTLYFSFEYNFIYAADADTGEQLFVFPLAQPANYRTDADGATLFGDNRLYVSAKQTLSELSTDVKSPNRLLWNFVHPKYNSTFEPSFEWVPVMSGQTLIMTAVLEAEESLQLLAFDAQSHRLIWETDFFNCVMRDDVYLPAVDERYLYIPCPNYKEMKTFVFDMNSGKLAKQFTYPDYKQYSPLIVTSEYLFARAANWFGPAEQRILAFDKTTGHLVAQYDLNNLIVSMGAPSGWAYYNRSIYATYDNGIVACSLLHNAADLKKGSLAISLLLTTAAKIFLY